MTKDEARAELKKLRARKKELQEILDISPKEKAQEIMTKLFTEFEKGAQFLEEVSQQAETSGTLMTPIGRRRNLYRTFTGIRSFLASAQRRAKNSPIQGMASELGMLTGYLILRECDSYLEEGMDSWPLFSRVVHDALYFEVPYAFVLPFIHIMQYTATYGVAEYVKETFNWPLTVEPEIEIELSTREDHSFKWDWALPQLKGHLEACLNDQVEMGLLKKEEVAGVMSTIFAPWKDAETRKALQERYPLLGVKGLGKQIKAACAEIAEVEDVEA